MAAIFAVVMVITSALYFRGRDAVAQSSDKIDTAGRSRRTMDRLTPVVASAIEVGGFEALEFGDPTPQVLTDPCHLDVTTRENFFDAGYSPERQFDVLGPYYRVRVAFEPASQELRMYPLKLAPVEIDDSLPPQLLAQNVIGCRFESVTVGSAAVTIETRAERDDERRPGGVLTTRLDAILVAPGTR